jgi:PAS domain S-box-containing protein
MEILPKNITETLIQVLHLEDDPAEAERVQATLLEAGLACLITRAQTWDEFETGLSDGGTDIILADYRLSTLDGMSALHLAKKCRPDIPFIYVSGTLGEEVAIEALIQGATDYVLKHNLARLASAVQRALQEARNRSERKQTEETLQHSNEMLRAIIETAPATIVGLDLDGYVKSVWNPEAEKMLGWSAQEVMGRPMPSVPADRKEEFRGILEQIRNGMTVNGVEARRQRRDGTPIDYKIYASPLRDGQDRISGHIAVLMDISEQKRADAALKASEARYFDLYENAPDMYVSVNAQTASITHCNQTLADVLGYTKAEIIGRSIFKIYHPDCMDQAKQTRSEFLASGEIHDRELQLRKKDGSKLDVSLSASARRAKDGAIVSSRVILRDITERRRNNMINAARIRLMQYAVTHSLDDLLEETINEAEKVTESLIGFYHFVDDDQQALTLQNWSTRTKAQYCKARNKGLHYPITQAGVWVDCVLQRKPVVHNDYMSLSHRKGLPEGHAVVVRELVVPVLRGEKIKAILGVGNKPTDYSQKDVEALSLLADLVWEITERKQAETALAAREHEFRTLAENLPDKIVRYDREGRAVYINPVLETTLGDAASDRIGKRIREFHPDGSYDGLAQAVDKALASGENGEIENRILIPGKEPLFYQIRIITERDEHGEVTGVLAIGRDITARKLAEQERQANLKFFESMDRVNRAIKGADDLEEMTKDVLDAVLSTFNCDRAFLMYPCDPEAQSWTIPMERSKPEYPSILDSKQEMPMDPQAAEPLRILLAADGPVAFGPGTPHALPEDMSKQFGFKCLLSMAIYPKTGSPWQFGIHQCAYTREWTAEEMRLFEAIGRRLADGLSSLLSYRDLRKSEEFLENVVEHIPDMIFVKDAQTLKFVRFNRAGEQLLGYSREELLGKSDYDFFSKEEAESFTAKDREVLDAKALEDVPEETIRNRHNEELILHTKKIPILDEAGNPQFLLGISEDITERMLTEASIRKLSQAIEQSPVSIVITNVAGTIEFVNTKFTQVTGYSRTQALGENPRILKSGETPDKKYRQLWETIGSGGVWQGELRNRKKNGELFWEQATIAPVRNADDVITHYVAVKEDITERKKLEAQLRQTQKMEAVGQLAGGVAHDFNNMLGVIIGHAELALRKAATDADNALRNNLEGIREAGLRSAEITRQLLAFARKQTIVPKILDLNETVEGMLKLLRRLIGEDVYLAWLPGAKLWPVKMDPSQVDQILANLCVNARDAISGVGKITIETHRIEFDDAYCAEHKGFHPGEFVMLAVTDNGGGMDKSTMDKLFEPFFTTKEIGRGTGLGLATVYGIVKQNQGFINVYSEPQHGSTFKIYLPRHTGPSLSEKEPKTNLEPQDLSGHETILVVEDEILNMQLVELVLETYGYQVLAASSPSEALHMAKKRTGGIDLLLTDLVMPEMNGRDLAKEVTSLYPDIKCLFMSGYTGNAIVHHGVLDEGIHFLQKPFSKKDLAAKVREVLDAM